MDLFSLLFITAAVLGVLLVMLAVIAVVVLLPPVRHRLAERARDAEALAADVDAAVADPQPANSDGAEPEQR